MAEPTKPPAPQVTPADPATAADTESIDTAADQAQVPEAAGPAHDEPAGQHVDGSDADVIPLGEQEATPVLDRPGSSNRLSPSDVRAQLAEHDTNDELAVDTTKGTD